MAAPGSLKLVINAAAEGWLTSQTQHLPSLDLLASRCPLKGHKQSILHSPWAAPTPVNSTQLASDAACSGSLHAVMDPWLVPTNNVDPSILGRPRQSIGNRHFMSLFSAKTRPANMHVTYRPGDACAVCQRDGGDTLAVHIVPHLDLRRHGQATASCGRVGRCASRSSTATGAPSHP